MVVIVILKILYPLLIRLYKGVSLAKVSATWSGASTLEELEEASNNFQVYNRLLQYF